MDIQQLTDAERRVIAARVEQVQALVAYRQHLAAHIADIEQVITAIEAGQKLYRAGNASKGLPACAACHGPVGAGIPAQYPRIGGQFAEYTEAQLKSFRAGERANDPNRMMRAVADKMSDTEIKAISDYIAGLR